jgi:uncharacterized heparinase superfamily protein
VPTTQAASLASADEPSAAPVAKSLGAPPTEQPVIRAPVSTSSGENWRPALWPQALKATLRNSQEAVYTGLRPGFFYRLSLRGPITDRIAFHPLDPRTRKLDEADAYFRGRFRFAGETVEAKDKSIFECAPPSNNFSHELHGFEWLRHLEAASGGHAREFALNLAHDWLRLHSVYSKPAWQPETIALRFINLFAHGRFFLTESDLVWRSKFFVSLRNQTRMLARTISKAPAGLPRLRASAALALAGLCLSDRASANLGLKHLAAEIETQILPDGGHVSRSPQALIDAFHTLAMVQQTLDAANRETQTALRGALDRMATMVRFFRLGDGGLAVFNGGCESDRQLIKTLLDRDDVQGRPFGHAPHSAFQRLAGGRTLLLLDVGAPPPQIYSTKAHAGCLSFEMSAGGQRLVVNCGAAPSEEGNWAGALRATAAHSTVSLADRSSSIVLQRGYLRRALGPRLIAEQGEVLTRRSENAQGLLVEASHNYYLQRFGIVHRRRLALSPKGLLLTGTDQFIPTGAKSRKRGKGCPFAIRFHIHPDVRLSLAQGGGSVILKLPNGEGWRFRCSDGTLSIEESVYLGGGNLRRCEQLVVGAHVRSEEVEIAWLFEQIGAG